MFEVDPKTTVCIRRVYLEMFEVHRKCDCAREERRCHRSESEGRASIEEREGGESEREERGGASMS